LFSFSGFLIFLSHVYYEDKEIRELISENRNS
jgi:hypothetical protein